MELPLLGFVGSSGVLAQERAHTGAGDTVTMRKPAISTSSESPFQSTATSPTSYFYTACPEASA